MKKLFTLIVATLLCANILATEGALSGRFTINSDGDQIVFSQGNLQYQASSGLWRFATNQYDYVGDETNGNVFENGVKCNNALISETYDGWIDLFGWGTGDTPTKKSTNYGDYTTFTDWGANPISNGGNEANLWRTLTVEETEYLFFQSRNSGRATVNGVHGIIFLPDNWTIPTGLSFVFNTKNWTTNDYSVSEWQQMQKAGAIFLPCAGQRNGNAISLLGKEAMCWSGTSMDEYGYDIEYGENLLGISLEDLYLGFSVRLVQAAPPCDIPLTEIYETACDKFVWNDDTYTASGDITKTFKAVNGCDSIVTLHLTINYSTTGEETVVADGSYEWNGTTYTASGDYQYTLTNVHGCDSVATLHLTIKPIEPNFRMYARVDQAAEWASILYFYASDNLGKPLLGDYPGTLVTETEMINDVEWYYLDFYVPSDEFDFIVNDDAKMSVPLSISAEETDPHTLYAHVTSTQDMEGHYVAKLADPVGIEEINSEETKPVKFIHNGQLYIRCGDKIFTVTGQKVK